MSKGLEISVSQYLMIPSLADSTASKHLLCPANSISVLCVEIFAHYSLEKTLILRCLSYIACVNLPMEFNFDSHSKTFNLLSLQVAHESLSSPRSHPLFSSSFLSDFNIAIQNVSCATAATQPQRCFVNWIYIKDQQCTSCTWHICCVAQACYTANGITVLLNMTNVLSIGWLVVQLRLFICYSSFKHTHSSYSPREI